MSCFSVLLKPTLDVEYVIKWLNMKYLYLIENNKTLPVYRKTSACSGDVFYCRVQIGGNLSAAIGVLYDSVYAVDLYLVLRDPVLVDDD